MSQHDPAADLAQMVNGYQVSQAISVAATLGLADHLKNGSRSSAELAAATGANQKTLYRLLRALASVGIFVEEEDQRFSLTALGDSLRSDVPDSVAAWAIYVGQPYYREAWSDLLYSIKTGANAFRHVHGTGPWEYRARNPEVSATFDRAMTSNARRIVDAVLSAYDFRQFSVLMDVGGGQGMLLAAILAKNSGLRGVLFDQPHVVAEAGKLLADTGVADRCEVVGGSFFDAVPDGADGIILKSILHDWDDEKAAAILQVCRGAIRADGKLLVLESVLAPPNKGARAKFSDLNMLVAPGGQERDAGEFEKLLAAAGFRLINIIPAGTSVIEAVPV
jgi:hypothetical protein